MKYPTSPFLILYAGFVPRYNVSTGLLVRGTLSVPGFSRYKCEGTQDASPQGSVLPCTLHTDNALPRPGSSIPEVSTGHN
eukprot:3246-Rhodomonas_salina.1